MSEKSSSMRDKIEKEILDKEGLEKLLNEGLPPNEVVYDATDETPTLPLLHYFFHNAQNLELLLRKGADVNRSDKFTPNLWNERVQLRFQARQSQNTNALQNHK